MKNIIISFFLKKLSQLWGLHPEVSSLIMGGLKLVSRNRAPFPKENIKFASHIFASGIWNYCFFQFYKNFSGPYWLERQNNPDDSSFIPSAVSMTSVNMTHRTWMGFRATKSSSFALIDPAGAISPWAGSYSLEFAIISGNKLLLPVRGEIKIRQSLYKNHSVPETSFDCPAVGMRIRAAGDPESNTDVLIEISYKKKKKIAAGIVIAIRPFNPEGVARIQKLAYRSINNNRGIVSINGNPGIFLLKKPGKVNFSNLEAGDAYFSNGKLSEVFCPHGIATGILSYSLSDRGSISLIARGPEKKRHSKTNFIMDTGEVHRRIEQSLELWQEKVSRGAVFQSARKEWNDAARIFSGYLLALQNGHDITPGVYTYSHFFFRDAAYMLFALINWNFFKEAKKVILSYPERQRSDGYFLSQHGEWDSNGQALWIFDQFCKFSGENDILNYVYPAVQKGVKWIIKKRRYGPYGRLFPASFSAEHLGPADNYYWDNFWGIAGIRAAMNLALKRGRLQENEKWRIEMDRYIAALLEISAPDRKKYGLLTAAPGRDIDPGMIGSIPVLFPLELEIFSESEIKSTVETIYSRFFHNGLMYHPIIHSGYNLYLSLQVAQSFFRLGEVQKAREILENVLKRRSALWTYPEALHPVTGGGVMGDGFHGWVYAEILLLLRLFLIYHNKECLFIFNGFEKGEIFGKKLRFGPFPLNGTVVQISGQLGLEKGYLAINIPNISTTGIREIHIHLPGANKLKSKININRGRLRLIRNKIIVKCPEDTLELSYNRG